jgi:hypothetical protein
MQESLAQFNEGLTGELAVAAGPARWFPKLSVMACTMESGSLESIQAAYAYSTAYFNLCTGKVSTATPVAANTNQAAAALSAPSHNVH